jgi:hypothetical protein
LWADRSSQVGLAQPSRKLLGFGTEWVDFDNDGSLELLVGNGHVDDVNRSDVGYYMPPQLFGRSGDGGYVEYERESLGEYFTEDHLARALATLDVNRDGRVDVAMTHLYEPVALLVNRTAQAGRAVGLELKATRSHRDAIGAVVTCSVAGRTVTKHVLAGDGYMCSNQRRLSIGSGDAERVRDVQVTWPSGQVEDYGDLEPGHDYLLIEQAGQPHRLHAHRQQPDGQAAEHVAE